MTAKEIKDNLDNVKLHSRIQHGISAINLKKSMHIYTFIKEYKASCQIFLTIRRELRNLQSGEKDNQNQAKIQLLGKFLKVVINDVNVQLIAGQFLTPVL